MKSLHSNKVIAIGLGYAYLAFHNLISFVLTPLMIGTWGDASYGVYKIILSLMTYFMLIDSGIKNSVIRFVSEYRKNNDCLNAKRYVATILSFYGIASVVLCVIVTIFGFFVPTIYAKSLTSSEIIIVKSALPFLLLYTIGSLFYNSFTAIIRGYNRQIVVQVMHIARTLVRCVVIIQMLKSRAGVTSVITADAFISIAFAAIALIYVFIALKIPPLFKEISKGFVKNVFSFSSIMLVNTLANSLFWAVGTFLVGILTSSEDAAVYTTAITITNMFQSLAGAVSQVLTPDIMVEGLKDDNDERINLLTNRVGTIKYYVMAPIVTGFATLGIMFVNLWVGEKYIGTYFIALAIMSTLFFGLIQDVPNNVMLARNKHKPLALLTLIAAVVNIVISLFLIQIIGIYGAAIGTVASYMFSYVVFTFFYYRKELRINMSSLYVDVVLKNSFLIVLPIGFGLLLNVIPIDGWIGFAIKVILFCVIYLALVLIVPFSRKNVLAFLGKRRKVK